MIANLLRFHSGVGFKVAAQAALSEVPSRTQRIVSLSLKRPGLLETLALTNRPVSHPRPVACK